MLRHMACRCVPHHFHGSSYRVMIRDVAGGCCIGRLETWHAKGWKPCSVRAVVGALRISVFFVWFPVLQFFS
jgi:hypothetical protein